MRIIEGLELKAIRMLTCNRVMMSWHGGKMLQTKGPWGNSYHSYRVTCPSHVTKRTSTAPVMLPLKSLSVMYSRTRSSFRRGVTPMAAVPTSWCSKSSQKISLSYQQKVGIQRGSKGFKLLLALIMTYLTLPYVVEWKFCFCCNLCPPPWPSDRPAGQQRPTSLRSDRWTSEWTTASAKNRLQHSVTVQISIKYP